jgi:arylsulfatase A-like enzyme
VNAGIDAIARRADLRRKAIALFVALVALAAILGSGACRDGASNDGPTDRRPVGTLEDLAALRDRDDVNLLFILVDTLRADRMSAYRYERDTTPNLRYLADTGIRFDRNWAQSSWTKSSMASLWTGLYPVRTDVLDYRDVISPEARMPAEILKEAGFATAGIWRNGWVAPNFGFGQGFDVYVAPPREQAPATLRQTARAGRIDGTDIDLVYSATEFLRANGDRRWFLYLHMMDVHQYVTTPDNAIFGSSYSDAYDNSVRWVDEQVGMILAELHALGLANKTLVVFAADHGEAFGEHGAEGHARDVHSEVVRTPLLLIPPFRLDPGIVVPVDTENVDIFPTALELLGQSAPDYSDGRSLLPMLLARDRSGLNEKTVAHLDRSWGRKEKTESPVIAIGEGNFRLIHDSESPDRLFNLADDPGEKRDVADSFHGIVKTLRARVDGYLEQTSPWEGGAPGIELDEMHLRQLRALGYSVER